MKWLLYFCCIISLKTIAQQGLRLSPSGIALGNNQTTATDNWAAIGNPASLGRLKTSLLGISCENRFGLNELNFTTAQYSYKLNKAALAMAVQHFGYRHFQQNNLAFAYGMELSNKMYTGVRLNYQSFLTSENRDYQRSLWADIGLIYTTSDRLTFGLNIQNIIASQNNNGQAKLPVKFATGVSYACNKDFTMHAQIIHELNHKSTIALGFAYAIAKQFSLRYGIESARFNNYFGFGIITNKLKIDFACSYTSNLGLSPALALAFPILRPRKTLNAKI